MHNSAAMVTVQLASQQSNLIVYIIGRIWLVFHDDVRTELIVNYERKGCIRNLPGVWSDKKK